MHLFKLLGEQKIVFLVALLAKAQVGAYNDKKFGSRDPN